MPEGVHRYFAAVVIGWKADEPEWKFRWLEISACRAELEMALSELRNENSVPNANPFQDNPNSTTNQSPADRSTEKRVFANIVSSSGPSHLERLSSAALSLNYMSDELTKQVQIIEEALNKLNLGIEAHVNGPDLVEDDGTGYSKWLRLAYGKFAGKWGLGVEELTEDHRNPESDTYVGWAFKEAPRDYRIQVVGKIPALLEALCQESAKVAAEISKQVQYTRNLVSTVNMSGSLVAKKVESK